MSQAKYVESRLRQDLNLDPKARYFGLYPTFSTSKLCRCLATYSLQTSVQKGLDLLVSVLVFLLLV